MMRIALLLCGSVLLAACGEQPQGLGLPKSDSVAYTGTSKAYMDPAWKAGDKVAWEQQLKARQQYGQNDYSRIR
ncbi:MAG: hypothetical protein K9K38_19625 [Rhodoferax sp.]|nr:hypothetical protein [Rhodoferax sp.]MCF8211587.1 hypothetical protein [Rhodoferax sp.]